MAGGYKTSGSATGVNRRIASLREPRFGFTTPEREVWQCVWISPLRGITRTFEARKVGNEIVLEGTNKDGYPERWIFSEIMPRSFRWRAVESHDGKKTWQLTEEMFVRRIGPDQRRRASANRMRLPLPALHAS